MATYVNDLRLTELATGEGSGTWGTTTNLNLELIGEALGYGTQDCFVSDADATTTVADGATDPARAMYFKVTSSATLTATRTLTIAPNTMTRVMLIENATTGSQSIAISQGSGGNVTIANGAVKLVYLDGAGAGAAVVDALVDLELTGTTTVANLTVSGTTTLAGASTTADITFGDNDKAVFGAGSDLQIYHDGSASYIDDAGTGNLRIRANSSLSIQKYTGETMGVFTADGSVLLAHDNATKFETTATGIDVTGTVTADGLTVDGSGLIQSSTGGVLTLKSTDTAASTSSVLGQINFYNSDSSGSSPNNAVIIKSTGQSGGGNGDLEFKVTNSGIEGNDALTSLRIDDAGDISFYEDTGTTPKFFWDASAEALGIGTTSPQEPLSVESSGQRKILATNTDFASGTTGSSFDIGFGATSGNTYTDLRALISGRSAWGDLVLQRGGGNVGIGTTSPSYKTTVEGENEGAALTLAALHNTGTTAGSEARLILAGGNGLTTRHAYISAINGGSAGGNAHALTFATNAAAASPQEAMRITSAGDVGIGTSSPATPLEVQTSTDNSAYIRVGTSSNGGHTIGDDIAALEFYGADASGSGAGVKGSIRYQYGSTSGATTHMAFAVADVSGSNDVERMRIDSSGRLLVGKTASNYGTEGVEIRSNEALITNDGGTTLSLNRLTSDGTILGFAKDSTTVGSIGIETTGFYVDGESGHTGLKFRGFDIIPRDNGSDVDGGVNLGASASRFGDLYLSGISYSNTIYSDLNLTLAADYNNDSSAGNSNILFQTDGSEVMRITSAGRVGIGNDASGAAERFQVSTTNDLNAQGYAIATKTSGTGTINHFRMINGNGVVGSITTNGSTTSFNTSSDYRLKDVDGPITNSGAYIDALKPVQGSWKADGSRFIGLIAHEVQEISETPISTGEKDGEEMQGMSYSAPELIANLIAEIQSLRARVAQLEGA